MQHVLRAVKTTLCGFQDPGAVVFKPAPEVIYVKLNSLNLLSLCEGTHFSYSLASRLHHAHEALGPMALICPITV